MDEKAKILVTVLVFLLVEGISGAKPRDHYCGINKDHTMCLYVRPNSMGLRCWDYRPTPHGKLRNIILSKHNSWRHHYASGDIGKFHVPNMLALEWDTELAEIAARWAMQCPYYEDDFRDVDRFRVAQAVGIAEKADQIPNLYEVWNSLTSGNLTFHVASASSNESRKDTLLSGFMLDVPLTLITNPYFKYVGCASASYNQIVDGSRIVIRTILVCNYGPLLDSYGYRHPAGQPCTRCPADTKCDENSLYPSLCFDKNYE